MSDELQREINLDKFDPLSLHLEWRGERAFHNLVDRLNSLDIAEDKWPIGLDNQLVMEPGRILTQFENDVLLTETRYTFSFGPPYLPKRIPIEYALHNLWYNRSEFDKNKILRTAVLTGGAASYAREEMYLASPALGKRVRFIGPSERRRRLDRLIGLISGRGRCNPHPFVDALMIFIEFMTIHPLTDGNGRVARCLFQYRVHQITGLRFPLMPLGCLAARLRHYFSDTMLHWQITGNYKPFFELVWRYVFISHGEIWRKVHGE